MDNTDSPFVEAPVAEEEGMAEAKALEWLPTMTTVQKAIGRVSYPYSMTHDGSPSWVIIAASLTMSDFEESFTPGPTSLSLEAEFLDIRAKVLRNFLLVIHNHLYTALPWDFYFFKLMQPLTVSVKEKGGKPDTKLYPLPYGLRSPYRNLRSGNSQDYAQKLNVERFQEIKMRLSTQ
jgi:hypothetical protein